MILYLQFQERTFSSQVITDGTASLSSGSLTSAVNGTFSGTVQAEHLHTTDDLSVGDDATIGGDLTVTGNTSIEGNTTLGNATTTIIQSHSQVMQM